MASVQGETVARVVKKAILATGFGLARNPALLGSWRGFDVHLVGLSLSGLPRNRRLKPPRSPRETLPGFADLRGVSHPPDPTAKHLRAALPGSGTPDPG